MISPGRRISDLIESIAGQRREADVVVVFKQCMRALGADAGVFATFISADNSDSFNFYVDCTEVWCSEYQNRRSNIQDPCIAYAATRTEPVKLSQIPVLTHAQRDLVDSAQVNGFASGAVFPAPSAGSVSRIGVLTIGSRDPAHFEGDEFQRVRSMGRLLAMELNEWWIRHIRERLLVEARLSTEDLDLLRYEAQGLKSKAIAKELGTTPTSIDSRFQRINAKLRVPTRSEAARVVAENGLL